MLRLFMIIGFMELLVGFCWSSSMHSTTQEKCRIRQRTANVQNIDTSLTGTKTQSPYFHPFRFRANSFGMTKYRIDAVFQNQSVLNIKVTNGALPDSVKGGHDLDGAYAFVQSFFVTGKHVHSMNNKRFDLEMWNVYVKKNNSGEPNSPHKIISINILFQIANQSYSRLNPVVSAVKKMLTFDTPWLSLPDNYDPYALLSRINSFAVYESNSLPFPYPQPILQPQQQQKIPDSKLHQGEENRKDDCPEEWPTVKIYVSRKPQLISPEQLEIMEKAEKQFGDHHHHNRQKRHEPKKDEEKAQIYLTPLQEQTLVRRSRSALSILDIKVGPDGQSEPPQFPEECQFLEVIHRISKKQKKSSATSFQQGTVRYLFCLLTVKFLLI